MNETGTSPPKGLADLFQRVEGTMLAKFREAGFVNHPGDKGDNREEILREFLEKHLPDRFGVIKGEILTQDGARSHSADVIIYDATNCPVLYQSKTALLPIEGVYGIIEVKSQLSKDNLLDAASKIKRFKELAPRELAIIKTRNSVTLSRPSRPFGIVLGYDLAGNSLESLKNNLDDFNREVHYVNLLTNLVAVLGVGLLRLEMVNLTRGEKFMLLDTDEVTELVETQRKKDRAKEECDEILLRVISEPVKDNTFGRFFVYLLIMLLRMRVNPPDLARYFDPTLDYTIIRES